MKIFTIIVTYNGEQWIRQCLESLLHSSVKTEIIVVDNLSIDATTDIIRSYFPTVEVLTMNKNLGFGSANNLALKIALERGADYFFLLNQDAWVQKDTIENLLNVLAGNHFLGIVSPLHLNGNGSDFDKNFYTYLVRSDIESYLHSLMLHRQMDISWINTKFVNAAAWLVSKKCIMTVGGFDPYFFHYGEDRNFCQRVIYNGFVIGIVPSAVVYHDREKRSLLKKNLKETVEHDFLNFKLDASNVRRPGISFFIFKRICRHLLLSIFYLFSFSLKKFEYNRMMVFLILGEVGSIYACRRRSKTNQLLT